MINIITRTSDNPRQFQRLIKNVRMQWYKEINHIIIADNASSVEYVKDIAGVVPYYVDREQRYKKYENEPIPKGHRYLPWNTYFNDIESELLDGWILYLDSDDILENKSTIQRLMAQIKDEDTMYTFKTMINGHMIMNTCPPVLNRFSGGGFIFHTKFFSDDLWPYISGGDFFAATKLFKRINKTKYLDMLVEIAPKAHRGSRQDDL